MYEQELGRLRTEINEGEMRAQEWESEAARLDTANKTLEAQLMDAKKRTDDAQKEKNRLKRKLDGAAGQVESHKRIMSHTLSYVVIRCHTLSYVVTRCHKLS